MELVFYILFAAAVIYLVGRALISEYFADKLRFHNRITHSLTQGGPNGQ